MNGVNNRSAEFGLRPMLSMAAAVARPCPSPTPKAAKPMPIPAPSAIRPPAAPATSPPSAASAGLAIKQSAKIARNVRTARMLFSLRHRIRRPPSLFSRLSMRGSPVGDLEASVVVRDRQRDVHRADNREDKGLQYAHERTENIERNRDHQLGEIGEDPEHE